ncbi:VIR protein [Plasmodium vivax]|uniref:VIR protein n=1 Tax=Plasmodium vivax TaxID=5855 RepID=A0A1G4E5C3_PLAVI|nr:VIR protein [Plasmodium vivax]
MASNRSNPQYFTYQNYSAIKKSFVYETTEEDVISANDFIKDTGNTPEKELILRKTFCELKKLVRRGDTFYRHGLDSCCNYINYWLNKTVRESDYRVNEQNFKMFDEFMKLDPIIKGSSINCISKLSYMNTDTFKKTNKLYDLYDYFTKLKESKVPTTLCHSISDLTEKYESVFKECNGKDNNLCDKLTNLKSVIVKDELVVNDVCTKTAFDSFILKIDPPREEQKAVTAPAHRRISGGARPPKHVSVPSQKAHGRHPGEKPTPPSVSGYSPQELGRSSRETPAPTAVAVSSSPAQGLETQARVENEQTLSVSPGLIQLPLARTLTPQPSGQSGPLESPDDTSEPTGPKGPYEIPELASELGQGQLQEHRPRFPSERQEWPEETPERDAHYFSGDERHIFPEEGDPSADSKLSTFDTGTIMGTIKDVVSNVLEAVEPVPILGVSGGMGALYLLLKYTPIGSLFGRNRRNNQNIPNFFDPEYAEQFSGYYPQYYNEGFPNYRMNIAYHPSSEELD